MMGSMHIRVNSQSEADMLVNRWAAICHQLGPTVELVAYLPEGRVLRKPLGGSSPAAQVATWNERLEQRIQSRGVL